MRRKPYSELLAAAQTGLRSAAPRPAQPRQGPGRPGFQAPAGIKIPSNIKVQPASSSGPTNLTAQAAAKCRAEIRLLSAMIDKYRATADNEGQKMCLFADEKVARAAMALDSGDGDDAWVQLFGAAMLCRTFQILPEEADRAIARLNSMLG